MNEYIVVSFSGGKDSTAMLLHMIELGEHIDEVITCDTGMEFPAMYRHIEKVRAAVEAAGIKFTVLSYEKTFENLLTQEVRYTNGGTRLVGIGWPSARLRWCTAYFKDHAMSKYKTAIKKRLKIPVFFYVGLAADEQKRLERGQNKNKSHRHPLVEWGWKEADALQYCYDHGYDWEGLYKIFKRVSCWCCPLQPIPELRKLYHNFPNLWQKLKELDSKQWRQFRADYSLNQLEQRFIREDAQNKAQILMFEEKRERLYRDLGVGTE